MPVSLSISVVVFRPNPALLADSLRSIAASLDAARRQDSLGACHLAIVDNDAGDGGREALRDTCDSVLHRPGAWFTHELLEPGENLGYGAANNLAIASSRADYHLVLNPDVILEEGAIAAALDFMERTPHVALLTPLAVDATSARQYLCKRYPSLWVLFLRGLGPRFLQHLFTRSLARYEMRDETGTSDYAGRFLASGCFMLIRRDVLRKTGGFDPGFFMYFEDYDLSMRVARHAELAFVPAVRIVHHGGNAAGKGWGHRRMFFASALRFFRLHGWRLV